MKTKHIENGLALLAALIIMAGVSAAANAALAGGVGTLEIYQVALK